MRSSQGQALVEAAIVLPLVVFVTAILIELCLISNAKSVLRYSAFCTARYLSVEPWANPEEIKTAAVIPLLGVTGRSQDSEFRTVTEGLQAHGPVISAVGTALSSGAGFSPASPMEFNRDLEKTLKATWSRTFVLHTTENGNANAEVTYFYHPIFPLTLITQMIQEPWLQEPSPEMAIQITNMVGDENYEQWRKSDWLVLTATAKLPLEPQ